MKLPLVYVASRARSARRSSPPFVAAARACFFALACTLVACGSPFVEAQDAPAAQVDAPLTLDCHAHTFLYVGTYANRWADWRLTVDATGHAHGELAVVDGPTTTSDGDAPALVMSFGDDVAFDLWSADGRGHFVQPYPGLAHGFDIAVECQ